MEDARTRTSEELVDWIGEWFERELGLDPGALAPEGRFIAYGMDSIHATMLVGDLEELLGRRLPPTLPWDHPTALALAEHLSAPTVAR